MSIFKKPRGTTDWFGDRIIQFQEIAYTLKQIAESFCFQQIDIPTMEHIELFKKSIGEVTDITQKELYTIIDKKNRVLALRPEGTSGVVRAYVENKMYANKLGATKLFYLLKLFRYERPQSGRLREFHQFGIEYLNVNSHLQDIECLLFANQIIQSFNLSKYITLKINYLGNLKQRQIWIEELKTYFAKYEGQLTQDSINRLNLNPLRILDDKIDGSKSFVKNAPKLDKYLTDEDRDIFNAILAALKENNVNFEIDDSLVRGLDYYTGIVFEFVYTNPNYTNNSLTLIGGGRYSELISQTGGPNEIGLGFAIGIERLLNALNETNYPFSNINKINIFIGASSYDNTLQGIKIAQILRQKNYHVEMMLSMYKKDKNAHYAIKNKANYFIFINDDDLKNNILKIENLKTNKIEKIQIDKISEFKFE